MADKKINKKMLVALSVAGLVAASLTAVTPAHAEDTTEACYGVNSCKGAGACGGADHACAGKNACKGQGWIKVAKGTCTSMEGGRLTA